MLGEIRKTVEDNNLWEDSTIIVSSDHQWRVNIYQNDLSEKERQITGGKEDARVPFFLKLKGQKETAIYDKPFNTVILHDLILAIMKGEVSTVNEVQTWLNRYSTR
jgi:arylsulfatase A-like enzyme